MRIAILVDGGFYRKRVKHLFGELTPEKRADELHAYCLAHLSDKHDGAEKRQLYRIFYYDCPPIKKKVWHPLKQRTIDFEKQGTYKWTMDFFDALKKKRKVALRLGALSDEKAAFIMTQEAQKEIMKGNKKPEELSESDFRINFGQKGVDMRIGLDIASLAFKKQVDQIILISGDSDFVPAAKLARREGIDFILDPMGANIKDDLFEHIDGLRSQWSKKKQNSKQPLTKQDNNQVGKPKTTNKNP